MGEVYLIFLAAFSVFFIGILIQSRQAQTRMAGRQEEAIAMGRRNIEIAEEALGYHRENARLLAEILDALRHE